MEATSHRQSVLSLVGRTLDARYEILAVIGEGGMGAVYRAKQPDGPDVAVKVLHQELGDKQELRDRFEREARALFGLEHPNVLAVHDFGIVDSSPYIVMELLEGMPLDEYLEAHPPRPALGLDITKQVLAGLAYAHDQGAAHRDLKSENIWIQPKPDGTVSAKLLDFGLVKFTDDERWSDSRKLTVQGMVFGSPGYMPPEQCSGKPADERSDVYSMGVLLHELLTGEWPFMEENQVAMFQAHLAKTPPPIAAAAPHLTIHPSLEAVYQKALAKSQDDRFATAGEMLDAIEAISKPAREKKEGSSNALDWRVPAAIGLAIAIGAIVIVWLN